MSDLLLMAGASGLPRQGLCALYDPYRDAYGLDAAGRAALQTGVDYSGNCITADTRLFFGKGFSHVDQAEEPDTVYQDGGQFGDILKFWERPYTGEVVRIKSRGMSVGLTPNHKVLRIDRGVIKTLRRYGYDNGNPFPMYRMPKPEWVEAQDVCVGDFVLVPRPKLGDKDYTLEFGYGKRGNQKRDLMEAFENGKTPADFDAETLGIKKESIERYWARFQNGEAYSRSRRSIAMSNQPLDAEWAEIFGWWVAEGCIAKLDGIPAKARFCLSWKEKAEADRLVELLEKKGVYAYQSERGSSRAVTACSAPLSIFLAENFGCGAENKRIPNWMKEARPEILWAFLKAYNTGDGCITSGDAAMKCHPHVEMVTVSERLAQDVAICLMKLGIMPSFAEHPNNHYSEINGREIHSRYPLLGVRVGGFDSEIFSDGESCRVSPKQTVLVDDDYFYCRVHKVGREEYEGIVYDFASESHTLCAPFIIHNSNHATYGATTGASTDDPVNTGTAWSFDGGDFLTGGRPAQLEVAQPWWGFGVYNIPNNGNFEALVGKHTGTSSALGFLIRKSNVNKIQLMSFLSDGTLKDTTTTSAVSAGWHWVSYGWNGTQLTLNVDRLDATPVGMASYGPDATNNLTFGKYAYTGAIYFTGSLALAGFYSRYPSYSERMRSALYVKSLMAPRGVTLA